MSFKLEKCYIPSIWCGDSRRPKKSTIGDKYKIPSYYYKNGSRYECLKKGMGVGMIKGKKNSLPLTSLQHIPFIGEVYESKFKNKKIKSVTDLIKFANTHTVKNIEKLLKEVLTRSGQRVVDYKAYNSVLTVLYQSGVANLPSCKNLVN